MHSDFQEPIITLLPIEQELENFFLSMRRPQVFSKQTWLIVSLLSLNLFTQSIKCLFGSIYADILEIFARSYFQKKKA